MRILLVEDNVELADWLGRLLRSRNFAVDAVGDVESAHAALSAAPYDLAILDLSLPDRSGLELLREMRARRIRVPVLILTASGELQSRVAGLDAGADDYLAKPFAVEELEARIRALLRRSQAEGDPQVRIGDIVFETSTRVFTVRSEPLPLTPRERATLEKLTLRAGQVVPKEALAEAIFGFDNEANVSAVEVYVHRVRRKVAQYGLTIAALRGLGYVLRHEPTRKP